MQRLCCWGGGCYVAAAATACMHVAQVPHPSQLCTNGLPHMSTPHGARADDSDASECGACIQAMLKPMAMLMLLLLCWLMPLMLVVTDAVCCW
jgi:hypothetical protein